MPIPLPILSSQCIAYADMIKRSHKSPKDYDNLKFMIESCTLNSGEKTYLREVLKRKFSALPY